MSRGATGVNTLVVMATMLIVILAMVWLLPVVTQKLQAAGETSKCEWSILLASVQKIGSAGIAEGIPEGCKAKQVQITMANLEKGQKLAKNRIRSFADNKKVYNPQFFTDPDSKDQLLEFALDKIIADEMVACWEKVFKGNMPLFDQWWRLYDFPWSKTTEDAGQAMSLWIAGNAHSPPVNCIICSRITFADDVIKTYKGRQITSLEEFMNNNPVPKTSTPYMKYLLEGQSTTSGITRPSYSFVISEEGLVTLYSRINPHTATEFAKTPLNWLGITEAKQPINRLSLLPYSQEQIVSPDTGEGCTLIID